jgi:acyl-CoA synthetase (NDP forming)
VAGDPGIDAVLVIYVPPIVTRPLDVAHAIVRGTAAARADAQERGIPATPVLSCFMGTHGVPEGLRSLHEAEIPSYAFPESAAIALARAVRYGRWRSEPEGARVTFPDVEPARAAVTIEKARLRTGGDGPRWLEAAETREILSCYGLSTPETPFARSAAEAVVAARRLGFPVALKLASRRITHKSEVGGVVLDLSNESEVREAFEGIAQRLRSAGLEAEMDGVVVQPMITEGIEAIVGVTHDSSFGPLVMFGLGGVHVELLRDVTFRVNPLTDRDAHDMVRAVRSFPLLEGFRGAPSGDVAALEEALLRVSRLVEDHPEIVEMDLNPIKVLPPGRGCVVVDARIAIRD